MQRVSREGWEAHLASVSTANASAFFNYLAKEEGRKPRDVLRPCHAPLLDDEGALRFVATEKCELLADYLGSKFQNAGDKKRCQVGSASSAEKRSSADSQKKSGRKASKHQKKIPLTPNRYGGEMERESEEIAPAEIRKAILNLATKKAAGPDGYTVEMYQHLQCPWEPIRRLFVTITQTG